MTGRDFQVLLRGFDLGDLEKQDGVAYGLWPDLTLAWVNPAWYRFARENGGEPAITHRWALGRSIADALPEPLLTFYRDAYHNCLRGDDPWSHDYECSSDRTYRLFRQTAYPLGEREGLLVVNSLRVEHTHDPVTHRPCAPAPDVYQDRDGVVCQCATCRRFLNRTQPQRWDWIPSWLNDHGLQISHGLCPVCLGFLYPDEE